MIESIRCVRCRVVDSADLLVVEYVAPGMYASRGVYRGDWVHFAEAMLLRDDQCWSLCHVVSIPGTDYGVIMDRQLAWLVHKTRNSIELPVVEDDRLQSCDYPLIHDFIGPVKTHQCLLNSEEETKRARADGVRGALTIRMTTGIGGGFDATEYPSPNRIFDFTSTDPPHSAVTTKSDNRTPFSVPVTKDRSTCQ